MSSDDAPAPADIGGAQKVFFKEIQNAIARFLESRVPEDATMDSDHTLVALQEIHEVLSFHVGFTDGTACISGAHRDERTDSYERFFKVGKQAAYDDHSGTGCLCEGAKALWTELNPN